MPRILFQTIQLLISFDSFIVSGSLIWIKSDTPSLPKGPRYAMITGSYDESIYLLGGTSGGGGYSDIIEYNINTNDYTVHTDTVDSMNAFSTTYTQINTVIYIYCSSTDYIVTYDMASNTYNSQFILKQNTKLEDVCVTNVNAEYLFVLGGYLDSTTTHNGFHIYNLLTHQWISDGPNMEEPRMFFTCQVHNNQLYVIGGSTNLWVNPVNTVSVIDISDMNNINQQNWNTLQDTLNGRIRNLNSVVYGNNIYVIGGYFGSGNNDAVNVIDTISNTIYVDSNLVSEISDTAAVVASGSIYTFGGSSASAMSVSFMQYAVLPEITIDITSHPSTAPTDNPSTVQPSTSPSHTPITIQPSTSPSSTSTEFLTNQTHYENQSNESSMFTSETPYRSTYKTQSQIQATTEYSIVYTPHHSSITSILRDGIVNEATDSHTPSLTGSTESKALNHTIIHIIHIGAAIAILCIVSVFGIMYTYGSRQKKKQIKSIANEQNVIPDIQISESTSNPLPKSTKTVSTDACNGEQNAIDDNTAGAGMEGIDESIKDEFDDPNIEELYLYHQRTVSSNCTTSPGGTTEQKSLDKVTQEGENDNTDYKDKILGKCVDCHRIKQGRVCDEDGMFYCNKCYSLY